MDKLQRIDHLRKLIATQQKKSDKHTHTIRWRGEDLHPVVINVETSFLKYRIESGRTRRKQIEYIKKYPNVPPDIFQDPESKITQDAQHQILLGMVDVEGLRKDIKKEGQKQPAIITYDGYVLNGNRRLAAMRDENIQFINCVVLPDDAIPGDLFDLELDLQMAKETKADYNWVDELLHIRYGIEQLQKTVKILANKMRTSSRDIQNKINMLYLVDLYLDWLEKPGQYYLVEGDEQVFIELEKFSRKVKDPDKQALVRLMTYGILNNPPSHGRLYRHVTRLYKRLDAVENRLDQSLQVDGIQDTSDNGTSVDTDQSVSEDPLETLAETTDSITSDVDYKGIQSLFQSPSLSKENVPILIDLIQDTDEEEKEKEDRKAAYNTVSGAQRKLQGIAIDSTTAEMESIKNKLNEIIKICDDLIKSIDTHLKGL